MNLAARLRPTSLDQFVGQEEIVGSDKIIRHMIQEDNLFSIILWGPPGTGKTTLATLIAHETKASFYMLSGVESGKDDLRRVVALAKKDEANKKRTILFIDEIHRWSKAQQDSLLPYVESGLVILIGATTENPSFEVISALLSRCKVFVLNVLSKENLDTLITRALTDNKVGLGKYKKTMDPKVRNTLMRLSGGDARILLNAIEIAVTNFKEKEITDEIIGQIFQTKSIGLYDKKADEHYNTISAFIKSMRASDTDASLYYLLRMLQNGEDLKFIARRMIIFAAEDIGIADRGALVQANACFEAVHKIGMPEAQLILSYGVIYLARAPKSRAVANALMAGQELVKEFPNEPIPLHLRNAPTKLMKELGYANDYTWSEKYVGPTQGKKSLPEKIQNKKIFTP